MMILVILLQVLQVPIAVRGIITKQPSPLSTTTVSQHIFPVSQSETNQKSVQQIKFDTARKARKIKEKSPSWQSILKDASFHSLIKHTGFTPSLEEKLESDRILWEKIQTAKFLRKSSEKFEESPVKMGILVDMTGNGGSLEFRQSDQSVYTCPNRKCDQLLQRLLAVWKIHKFEPNDSWIHVKVPRPDIEEDVYEFTPKDGLQQVNTRFSKTRNMTNIDKKRNTVAPQETLVTSSTLDERLSNIGRRMDLTQIKLNTFTNKEFLPTLNNMETKRRVKFPTTTLNSSIYDEQWTSTRTPAGLSRFHSGSQSNVVTVSNRKTNAKMLPFERVAIEKEFKNHDLYDGFLPSMGPTGSTFVTPVNYLLPYDERVVKEYDRHEKNVPITKPKEFVPSPNYIQYSELDPFYHDEQGSAFIYRETTIPPHFIEESTESSTTNVDNQLWTNSTTYETTMPHNELTDGSIKISRFTDAKGNRIDVVQTNHKKTLATPTTTKENRLNYAPLYIEWGNKIKSAQETATILPPPNRFSSDYKSKHQLLTTEKANMIIDNIENKSPEEVVNTLTNIGINNSTPVEENNFVDEIESTTEEHVEQVVMDSSKEIVDNPTNTGMNNSSHDEENRSIDEKEIESTSKGVFEQEVIDSTEEEVGNYTNIAVNNSSHIEDNRFMSEEETESTSKEKVEQSKISAKQESPPVSVIINRTSHSYAYKTAAGKIKYFKRKRTVSALR